MKKAAREFLAFAALPITFFALIGIFLILYNIFDLPSFDEILKYAEKQFTIHGYWVVFIAALLEGFLLINWFFPGTVVLVMGTLFASRGQQNVLLTLAIIMTGLYLMSILNYYFGKYGWYKLLVKFGLAHEVEKMKKRLEKHGLKILFITYFHPQIGSLSATAAGILQISTKRFLMASLLTYLVWATIWSSTVFLIGEKILSIINFQSLLILLAIWIGVMMIRFILQKLKKIPENAQQINE